MSQTKAQLLEPQGDFTLTSQLIGVGATFSGNVSIAGTLTKQDVTNVDSVGVITARQGVVVPDGEGYKFGDGSYRIEGRDDGANARIGFVAGGSERVRITSAGQIGIGTDNPTRELTIYSPDSSSTYINLTNSTTGTTTGDGFGIGLGGDEAAKIWNYENTYMSFGTNNLERLRITSDGNVHLNAANPVSSSLMILDKDGGGEAQIRFYNAGSNKAQIALDSSEELTFDVNGGERVRITSAGLVGIGTITPTRGPLHVHENSTGDVQIHLTNQETGTTSSDGFTIFSGANAGPNAGFVNREDGGTIAFYTHNGSSVGVRLTLSHTGNLTSTGTVSDSKGDLRKIPINFHNAGTYTLVAADAGKVVSEATMGSNITVPASTFVGGDAITIMNHTGNNITLTQGSGVTMYNAADASTGNRTLAGRGFATIFYREHNVVYISGSGLS